MRTRNLTLKLVVAAGVVAMLALPGEAKSTRGPEATVTAGQPAAQSVFGLFLDPHAEPVLHIDLSAPVASSF